jgi:hypothetical protein
MKRIKLSKKNSGLSAEKVAAGENDIKNKLKLYPIPAEDSFMPIQEDSEEIEYKTKKSIS